MVDLEQFSEQTKDATEATNSLNKAVQASSTSQELLANAIGKTTETLTALGLMGAEATKGMGGISGVTTKILNGISALTDTSSIMNELKKTSQASSEELAGAANKILLVGLNATGALPGATNMLAELGQAGEKAGFDVSRSFEGFRPALEKIFGGQMGANAFLRFSEGAEQAQKAELGMLRFAASVGRLDEVLPASAGGVQNLTNVVSDYQAYIVTAAEATGTMPSQLASWAAALEQLPGGLKQTMDVGDELGGSMTRLQALYKVSSALGIDSAEAQSIMTGAWREFNQTSNQTIDLIANIGQASQNLNLPMDIVKDRALATGKAFQMFGDQSQSAVRILGNVGKALEGSNIGPKAIDSLVGGMIGGIEKMDTATKAFISGTTGGPGGLAGAFEIDQMLTEEGGAQKVLDRVMKSMEAQFGGATLSRQDVLERPELAGEFQKQISFIKDFAGLANTSMEAQRVLEVMKGGGVGAEGLFEQTAPAQDAMTTYLKIGNDLQESQVTHLAGILQALQDIVMKSQTASLELSRSGQDGINRINQANDKASQNLNNISVGGAEGELVTADDRVNNTLGDAKKKMTELADMFSLMLEETGIINTNKEARQKVAPISTAPTAADAINAEAQRNIGRVPEAAKQEAIVGTLLPEEMTFRMTLSTEDLKEIARSVVKHELSSAKRGSILPDNK